MLVLLIVVVGSPPTSCQAQPSMPFGKSHGDPNSEHKPRGGDKKATAKQIEALLRAAEPRGLNLKFMAGMKNKSTHKWTG